MGRPLFLAGVATAAVTVLVSGCMPTDSADSSTPGSTSTSPTAGSATASAPSTPEPGANDSCPYLDTSWVERTNGQRVSEVRVSDEDPPACFFYTLDDNQQLMSWVYTGDPEVATALVDDAAPVDESNPATSPAGWKGGYLSGDDGATYAVSRDDTAVVVTTNQGQSVKARKVVERVVESLDL